MLNNVVFILFLSFCFSCGTSSDEAIEGIKKEEVIFNKSNLDWIFGEWIDSTKFKGKIVFLESWIKKSEQLYSGKKYSVKKGDTLSPTLMTITKTDGKFYYSYELKSEQITFVQDSISNNYISFRNTTNTFPDVLEYALLSDTLIISFSGITNGFKQGSSFKTIKIK